MPLSKSWQKLLGEHWKIIEEGNVEVFKEESNFKRALSLVFRLSPDLSQKIREDLNRVVPENLKGKIIFQPSEGYHLTLFWSPKDNLEGLDVPQFSQTLNQLFSKTPSITGTISFPHFGRGGMLSIFTTEMEEEIRSLRRKLEEIFLSFGVAPGFREEYYDLIWGSLTRHSAEFTKGEKQILKNLTVIEVPSVTFNKADLVLNDKFLTPENTKILGRFSLQAKIS
ncbi:MAG TPA: hypothetical protein VMW04_02580 [Patescibacteria group bacterium]|nr:hypothetical protein [Patescibacteria group bacterium]